MALGTIWNLPNYAGELYTADEINTPFLSMIGGLNGGLTASQFEFPTSSNYSLAAAAQPAITETASATAVASTNVARTQVVNTVQINQKTIDMTYVKASSAGRLSGLNSQGAVNNAEDELAFQQAMKLQEIARDTEYSFINGSYQKATDATTAAKTRGMVEVCQLSGGTNVNAAAADLSLDLMQSLFLAMHTAGALFQNLVIYVNGTYKQKISEIYGYAPEDRNIGGVSIDQIETDFGKVGIVVSRFAPANTVLAIEMSVCNPVFLPVPGKGNLFFEELAKTGATERAQMYGQIGLDHGPAFAHGRLYGLAA